MVTFNPEDYEKWKAFRVDKKSYLSQDEFTLVCELHARYYEHKFYKPSTCSPKEIKKWLQDLNKIWDNENH